jgi:hypothetical protein
MDRADEFCQEGELLTLAPTELEREFRLWFLREFIEQAEGVPPKPWTGPLAPDF